MPIVKKNQPLPPRPVIIFIYGEPGVGKSSIAHTCELPLLIDFDRGVDRSIMRQDALTLSSWNEVLDEENKGTLKEYKTITIDTAKAALDDYLMTWVVEQDYKLKTNKLGAYGAIGDNFKIFVNKRRSENADILVIAHAKKDEDTKSIMPDVTGGSYQLLMRIADQVGYLSMKNGRRVINWEPTELTKGKNVARLSETIVPPSIDPAFKTFGATLFEKVRGAMASMDEEQRAALEKVEMLQTAIEDCDIEDIKNILPELDALPEYLRLPLLQLVSAKYNEAILSATIPDTLTAMVAIVNNLPDGLKSGLRKTIGKQADDSKWVWNKEAGMFEGEAKAEDPADKASEDTTPSANDTQGALFGGSKNADYTKAYKKASDIYPLVDACTNLQDMISLYFGNGSLIEGDADLKAHFETKRTVLYEAANGKQPDGKKKKAGKEAAVKA